MNAIQDVVTVGEGGQIALRIARPAGSRVRVLIVDVDDASEAALELTRWQEQTGFVRQVLASPAEDVWNDL